MREMWLNVMTIMSECKTLKGTKNRLLFQMQKTMFFFLLLIDFQWIFDLILKCDPDMFS